MERRIVPGNENFGKGDFDLVCNGVATDLNFSSYATNQSSAILISVIKLICAIRGQYMHRQYIPISPNLKTVILEVSSYLHKRG